MAKAHRTPAIGREKVAKFLNAKRNEEIIFTRNALGRTSRAEQASQQFSFLGSLKLIWDVRFAPNSYRRRYNAANDAMCRYCCKKIFRILTRNIDSRNASVAQD